MAVSYLNVCKNSIPKRIGRKFDFYIADSKGVAIWNGDKIEVDVEGSGLEKARECDWTLEKYIRLSNAKYPSKARFFCVKKEKGILNAINYIR